MRARSAQRPPPSAPEPTSPPPGEACGAGLAHGAWSGAGSAGQRGLRGVGVHAAAGLFAALLLGACTSDPSDKSSVLPDTLDSDPPDTDVIDTDVIDTDSDAWETGWLVPGDTGAPDTDSDSDADSDSDSDSDTDPGFRDTFVNPGAPGGGGSTSGTTGPVDSGGDSGPCPLGEVPDCDGICFPAHFIGDGNCDDGASFQANFDCQSFAFDGGDCLDDTATLDTDTDLDGCEWVARTTTGLAATEMAWRVVDSSGVAQVDVPFNAYTRDNTQYSQTLFLPSGTYDLVSRDATGNGWSGGSVSIVDPRTGAVAITEDLLTGRYNRASFELECNDTDANAPSACGDISVILNTNTFASEISFNLVNERTGTNELTVARGSLSNFSTRRFELSLPTGWYRLELRDLFGDGWEGGAVVVLDGNGDLILSATLDDVNDDGRALDLRLPIDCSDTFDPAGVTFEPPDCVGLRAQVHTAAYGAEVGWELRDSAGTLVASAAPGTYTNAATANTPLNLGPDFYQLCLTDAGSNGWHGGFMEIEASTGTTYLTFGNGFTSGARVCTTFLLPCAAAPEPPVNTTCAPGAVFDCDGVCWPSSYVGDGFCDDGTGPGPDFLCATHNDDGGDCATP